MEKSAEKIYYSLSIFALGAGLFILQPSRSAEVTAWQNSIKLQFSVSEQQTMGDFNFVSDVGFIYDSVWSFYDQSASVLISLLSQPETDQDVLYVFGSVYNTFAQAFVAPASNSVYTAIQTQIPPNFMQEEPLYNIVPNNHESISGALIYKPDSANHSWVTIQDGLTGQVYCVASYNGEISKYLGECKNDY